MPTRRTDDEKRATAGVARFVRTWLPRLVVVAVVGAFVWAALRGSDGSGDSGEDDPASDDGTSSDGDEAAASPSSAVDVTDPSPPDVPVDIDEERPPVDLSQAADGADQLDVARWWGGTYVSYSGAEPPSALAERLADVITPELAAQLTAEPPAASYDAPTEIVGASATEVPAPAGSTASRSARVTVETVGALLVYDVTLTQDAAGAWRVAEATPV